MAVAKGKGIQRASALSSISNCPPLPGTESLFAAGRMSIEDVWPNESGED